MLISFLWLASLVLAQNQEQEQETSSLEVITLSGSDRRLTGDDATPTVRLSDFETSTFSTLSGLPEMTDTVNATASITASEEPLTELVGGTKTTAVSGNMTMSTTTSEEPRPTNTQPCNNYVELCDRRYSNITEVCAHNSPFVRDNNVGSNQALRVTQQLNDGIRVLQGQIHQINDTLYYCHTSCDLLNAGTVEDYLRVVTDWVSKHPYDVITIIFGNADYEKKDSAGNPLVTSKNFVDPIEKSGLRKYIYQPPKTSMTLDDWPTLAQLILSQKRVITFIDYNFDTDAVPYLLWEFHNIWETPFSPTNFDFPCTLGRPEGLSVEQQKNML